ncbi:Type II/IV secretion system ATP hydrolase TadA/VirB11/CpaF, TadA subfamily [hydrothermal vent metagenome]|uniref:Type II/IV secretion system ATP hydrolase TadA/VirB11/CpaF, TadA subfamily n=1 Tax=hydrothermal vent metagenome TaxID=652676 RepID=A0A3B1E1Y2_9ZZZZ
MSNFPYIDLEFKLVEQLYGKMRILQPQEEREEVVQKGLSIVLENEEFSEFKNTFDDTEKRRAFIQSFLSYDVLTELLCNNKVEDIIINNLKPIYIHHNQKGFISTEKSFSSQKKLDLFIKKILMFVGRKELTRITNLELPNLEGRVNIALSSFGPQLTITKAKVSPISIIELIRAKSMTHEIAAQLWIYLEGLSIRPANMMIAGGPGVGKTTLLNALFSFIPEKDRMVVIEDTLELNTFLNESCSRLESDEEVSLADWVKNSLRMRPERIIIGEVRGAEARDMITACNVGKYCIGTIHALTSREAIVRLQNEPMNVPKTLVSLIDVFIALKRYHADGKVFRVIDEISETSGMEQEKILLGQICKYDHETKQLKNVNPSITYRERLAKQAGILSKDIIQEHKFRTKILEELDQRNMITLKEVTEICQAYSENPDDTAKVLGLGRQEFLENTEL